MDPTPKKTTANATECLPGTSFHRLRSSGTKHLNNHSYWSMRENMRKPKKTSIAKNDWTLQWKGLNL